MNTLLLAALVLTTPATALPCDEPRSAATTSLISVSTSSTDDRGRSIEIRVENDRVVAKVDGKVLDDSRIRREGDRIVLLEPDGRPMATVPLVSITARGRASVRVGTNELSAEEIVIDGGHGQLTIGPRVRAEIDKAMRRVDETLLRAGPAAEVVRRYALDAGLVEPLAQFGMRGAADVVAADAPPRPRVMLGVTLQDPEPSLCRHLGIAEGQATLLMDVIPGLPADKAGLRSFDVVVEVDGQKPSDPARVRQRLAERSPGDQMTFVVRRPGGANERVEVTLEAADPGRLGAERTMPLHFDALGKDAPLLLETLRGQLRMAPLDVDRGDFLFELAVPSTNLPQATAKALAALPGTHAPAASGAADDARLDRLERRLEELASRLEVLMDRLMERPEARPR